MSDEKKAPAQEIFDAIAASGFPLQTAVAKMLATTQPYELVQEEYPWASATGVPQFLDIIARHGAAEFPIECKKTEKQSWIFLRPDGDTAVDNILRFRALFSRQVRDDTRRLELYFGDWDLEPASSESKFCIVSSGSRGGKERLIEPDAQLLLGATDDYAKSVRRAFRPQPLGENDKPYVPLLVTTAPLFIARYASKSVPLDTGRLAVQPTDLREVPWVRFRKTFATGGPEDVGERTIMVVNACHLAEFLKQQKIAPPHRPMHSVHWPIL